MKKPFRSTLLFLFVLIAFNTGCSSGGGGNDGSETGILSDTGIVGLRYQTASQSGTTGPGGTFQFMAGETISFWIGNLQIAADVPARKRLTPMDFLPANRELLNIGSSGNDGLSTHRPVEIVLAEDTPTVNIMRLLMILDEDQNTRDGGDIVITERVIEQFNQALADPAIGGSVTIDFNQIPEDFALTTKIPPPPTDEVLDAEGLPPAEPPRVLSAINTILEAICFFPADNEACETPPGIAELDAAIPRATLLEDKKNTDGNGNLLPGIVSREDIRAKIQRIQGGIRSIDEISTENVKDYLLEQTNAFTALSANAFFLSTEALEIPATDTGVKEIFIRSLTGDFTIDKMEVISTNDMAVAVNAFSTQTQSFEFFVTGDAGDEATLLINFKVAGDYRWIKKQLRVLVK